MNLAHTAPLLQARRMSRVCEVCAELRQKSEGRMHRLIVDQRVLTLCAVHARVVKFFESEYVEEELVVPYHKQRLVSELHDLGRVLEERYEQHGVIVRVQGEASAIQSVRSRLD